MATGGNYGPLGFVSAEDQLDGEYIRRNEYNVRGQIGTYDNIVGDFSVLPPGPNGRVLTARPALSNGLAWEVPSSGSITGAALGGAAVAGSGLVFTPSTITGTGTIALAASGVAAGTFGSATQVPVTTYDIAGRATGVVNTAISPITVNTTTPIAGGAAVAPGGAITLTHAATGLGTPTYNSVTFDATGHPTAGTSFTRAITGGTGITIGGGGGASAGFHAANANAMTVTLANTAVAAGAYGSGTQVGTFTVDAQGRLTLAANVAISAFAVNVAGPLTVSGTAQPGSSITLTNTALDSIATNNWRAGTGAIITAGQTNSVAIGNNALCAQNNVTIGSAAGNANLRESVAIGTGCATTVSQNSVIIGYQAADGTNFGSLTAVGYRAGRGVGVQSCTFIGSQAGIATTGAGNTLVGGNVAQTLTTGGNNTLLGASANVTAAGITAGTAVGTSASVGGSESSVFGFSGSCTGISSIGLGARCNAVGAQSIALGAFAVAGAINCNAIGYNVNNQTGDSTLIGDGTNTTHVVRSTGLFRSAVQDGAAAGRISTDGAPSPQTIAGAGTLATLNIYSTRYSDGGATVNNYLAATPNTITLPINANHYNISALVQFTSAANGALASVVLTIEWSQNGGGTWATLAQNMWLMVVNGTSGGINCAVAMKTGAAGVQMIRARLENNTTQTLTITTFRLSSSRSN